jgi:hypothetical protein
MSLLGSDGMTYNNMYNSTDFYGRATFHGTLAADQIKDNGLTANTWVGSNSNKMLESRTLQGTANQILLDNSGSVYTLSTPQDIDISANVTFNSVKLRNGTITSSATTAKTYTIPNYSSSNFIMSNSDNNIQFINTTSFLALDISGGFPALGSQMAFSYAGARKMFVGWSMANGCTLYDNAGGSFWLYQGGLTQGAVRSLNNILDNGTGGMTIAGTATLSALTASKPLKLNSSKAIISSNIELTTDVSGALPIANGGTNSSAALTNGKLMVSSGGSIIEGTSSSTPTFTTVNTTDLNVSGISTLSALTASLPLKLNASKQITSGLISLSSDVTSVLPIANGGTNTSTPLTNGKIMISSGGSIVEGTSSSIPTFTTVNTSGLNISGTTNISSLTASKPLKLDSGKNIVSNAIDLSSSDVTGVLPVSHGGTGGSTLVNSVTGTSNQITASPTTGAVVLTTPQNIDTACNFQCATISTTGSSSIGGGTSLALLDIYKGAEFDGSSQSNQLSFQHRTGGYRHYLRSRHQNTAGSGNGIDFFLNNSGTSGGSSAPGTGNVNMFSITGQGCGVLNSQPNNVFDIQDGLFARTGSHASNRSLYVTSNTGADNTGVEFRHYDGTQGIGLGYNTIYATGSNSNQDLGLLAKGTGSVIAKINGSVTSSSVLVVDNQTTSSTTNGIDMRLNGTSKMVVKYDTTNGIQFVDTANSNTWLSQAGTNKKVVTANTNVLDDGTGNMAIQGTKYFEFGQGTASKESNAGKIGYGTFTSGSLDIVGGGASGGSGRTVRIWDSMGIGTTPNTSYSLITGSHINCGGNLYLPTSGGTSSALNYYEIYDYATNITGGFTTVANGHVYITRIGFMVNVIIKAMTTTATSSSTISLSTALPARFSPFSNVSQPIRIIDNSTYYCTGLVQVVAATGVISMYVDAAGNGFNPSGAVGWTDAISITFQTT